MSSIIIEMLHGLPLYYIILHWFAFTWSVFLCCDKHLTMSLILLATLSVTNGAKTVCFTHNLPMQLLMISPLIFPSSPLSHHENLLCRRTYYFPASEFVEDAEEEHGPPFLQLGQRSFSSTPCIAFAMWRPQPTHEYFLHEEQGAFVHMMIDEEEQEESDELLLVYVCCLLSFLRYLIINVPSVCTFLIS